MNFNVLHKDIVGTEPGNILAQQFRLIVRKANIIPLLDGMVEARVAELNQNSKTVKTRGTEDAKILTESMSFSAFVNVLVNTIKVDGLTFMVDVEVNGNKILTTVKPRLKGKT